MQKTPRLARSVEVMGQCKTCLDLFTVTLLYHPSTQDWHPADQGGRNGCHRLIYQRETPSRRASLTHRPALCNGKVSLYGSPDQFPHHPPRNDTARTDGSPHAG